jgi:hypothetical protein
VPPFASTTQVGLIQVLGAMRRDRLLVLLVIATWVITGAINPHLSRSAQQATVLPQAVLLAILFFAWCKAHAEANAVKPPVAAPMLVGIFAPAGIPYYAFRAYGFRRGLLLCLMALLVLIVGGLAYVLSYFLSARIGT